MGTWKLNEAKSKIPAGAGKNTTVVYSPAGDETKVTTDGVDGLGKPSHSEWTGKFDGKPYPVTGMSSIDSRSVTAKGDRILDIANIKDGKTVGTGKTAVAKDGKSRTLETNGTLPDGEKYHASTSSTSNRRVSCPVGAFIAASLDETISL
jgi:hypothetical protein